MTKKARTRIKGLSFFGTLFLIQAIFGVATVFAMHTLGNNSPLNENSTPTGGHVFFLRKDSAFGVAQDINLGVYYDDTPAVRANWNSGYLVLYPGASAGISNVCNYSGGPTNDFVEVQLQTDQQTLTYKIDRQHVCDQNADHVNVAGNASGQNNNVLYGKYKLPQMPKGTLLDTTKMEVQVKISYTNFNSLDSSGNGIRIKVRGYNNSPEIGQYGTTGFQLPIIGDWSIRDQTNTQLYVPFALPCGNGPETGKKIGLYDADNGSKVFPNETVKFSVKDQNGNLVTFTGANKGKLSADKHWFTPDPGEKTTTYAVMTLNKYTRYEMHVVGLDPQNTIDIDLPENSIYGAGDVCKSFDITGTSKIDGDTGTKDVMPGQTVTFTHFLRNDGDLDSPNISGSIQRSGATTGQVVAFSGATFAANSKDKQMVNGSSYAFTIPATAANGSKYCQYIKWKPDHTVAGTNTTADQSAMACALVYKSPPPIAPVQYVNVSGNVANQGDIETQTTQNFSGSVNVSNFPQPQVGGWGFTETAIQQPPVATGASASYYSSSNGTGSRPSPSQGGCAGYATTSPYACNKYYWYCDGIYEGTSQPTCPNYTRHYCTGYSFDDYNSYGSCQYEWTCPSPNYYTVRQQSAPNCHVYHCQYSGAPNYYSTNPKKEDCEKRCSSGYGERPVKYDYGDMNCYIHPYFTMTCQWDTGLTTTATVGDNGSYCSSSVTKQAGGIGTLVCATLTTKQLHYSSDWAPSYPLPGWGRTSSTAPFKQLAEWRWNQTAGTGCAKSVGYPYLKVYGGDVRVGGGVGAKTSYSGPQSCLNPVGGSKILTNANTDYSGAGAQGAAFASGSIDGFVSGQYNDLYMPKALSFANVTGIYGGNFNTNGVGYPPCTGFVDQQSTATDPGSTIPGLTVGVGDAAKKIYHHVGDVYISNDIVYSGSTGAKLWSIDNGNIPLFQLVVEGNILIGANVHELDGLYAAVKNSVGTGGTIYTCATGPGVPANGQTFGPCKSQLVINGALAANRIYWYRDCGSLIHSNGDEGPVYSGGSNQDLCSAGQNGAAEVVNYSPELWIRSVKPDGDTKYDSISSLPPVL